MKKYKIARRLILGVLMISVILTACSQNTVETNQAKTESTTVTTTVMAESTTEKEATISESTTNKSDDSDTTAKPAEQKSAGQTTTKKVTTTQKPTTTKKVTTTEAPYFCDEGGTHHSCDAGPIGWVDSFDEAKDKALEYAGENGDSGNFRVKQCLYCGKYTATVTFK